jgi:hypothetical protein
MHVCILHLLGLAAAKLLDVEPEKERWRCIARGWYAQGLADTPGTGKLHYHLGLLSQEKDGEELRAVYHLSRGNFNSCYMLVSMWKILFLSA